MIGSFAVEKINVAHLNRAKLDKHPQMEFVRLKVRKIYNSQLNRRSTSAVSVSEGNTVHQLLAQVIYF